MQFPAGQHIGKPLTTTQPPAPGLPAKLDGIALPLSAKDKQQYALILWRGLRQGGNQRLPTDATSPKALIRRHL